MSDTGNGTSQQPPIEEPQTTEVPQEATALAEAQRRIASGEPAPTSADIAAAESPAQAQFLAEIGLLMQGAPPSPEDAPSKDEFIEQHGLEPSEGRTHEDMQARTNLEVALLSAENPPKEIVEQQRQGASHLPSATVPETMRSLSLEELANKRVELTNPGAPLMRTVTEPVLPEGQQAA